MTEECRIDDKSTRESVWRACAKFCESEKVKERERKKRKEEATIVDNVVHRLSV